MSVSKLRGGCQHFVIAVLAGCCFFCRPGETTADPPKLVVKLVEAAVAKHGGAKNLRKLKTVIVKYSISATGEGIPGLPIKGDVSAQVEEFLQWPHQVKKVISAKVNGKTANISWAISGEKCWVMDESGRVSDFPNPPDPATVARPFDVF